MFHVLGREMLAVSLLDADEPADHAEHRQQAQRPGHDRRGFVRVPGCFGLRCAEERDEDQPEHVERRERGHRRPENVAAAGYAPAASARMLSLL